MLYSFRVTLGYAVKNLCNARCIILRHYFRPIDCSILAVGTTVEGKTVFGAQGDSVMEFLVDAISGTSMATPHVAGLAVDVLGLQGKRTPFKLAARLTALSTKNSTDCSAACAGASCRIRRSTTIFATITTFATRFGRP